MTAFVVFDSDRRIEQEQLSDYITTRRELFLLKFSLNVKRDEIRKLEGKAREEEIKLEVCHNWLLLPADRSSKPSLRGLVLLYSRDITVDCLYRRQSDGWRQTLLSLISSCERTTALLSRQSNLPKPLQCGNKRNRRRSSACRYYLLGRVNNGELLTAFARLS